MIIDSIINLAYSIVNFFIGLFPAGAFLPSEIGTATIALGEFLALISPLVPLATLFTISTFIIVIELSIFGFRTAKWFFSFIPFIGGRG